jgi:hypothetical protein
VGHDLHATEPDSDEVRTAEQDGERPGQRSTRTRGPASPVGSTTLTSRYSTDSVGPPTLARIWGCSWGFSPQYVLRYQTVTPHGLTESYVFVLTLV